MSQVHKIISGGQTGADRGALRAAMSYDVPTGGWCPPGRASEDGAIPASFLLMETPHDRSPNAPSIARSQRTEWNVRDSDATLILWPPKLGLLDLGTQWTAECARRYRKPLLICDLDAAEVEGVRLWLSRNEIRVLNVAGPAESSFPGIASAAERFVGAVLQAG